MTGPGDGDRDDRWDDEGADRWDGEWDDGYAGDRSPEARWLDERWPEQHHTDPGLESRETEVAPEPGEHGERRERPRPRRWVVALALVTVFVLGGFGGVLADRYLSRDRPAPAVGLGTPLSGTVEGAEGGVLAVRTPDGALVAVRTSPETRVVSEEPQGLAGDAVPRGTVVAVLGFRDADGTLTATAVTVPAGR